MGILSKIAAKVRKIPAITIADSSTKRFIAHNKKIWKSSAIKSGSGLILVDFYTLHQAMISYSYFLNELSVKHQARICSYGTGNRRVRHVFDSVYRSFNCNDHFRIKLNRIQKKRKNALLKDIFPRLKTKWDVHAIAIDGIKIGTDIYESYLRDYNEPTVNINDERFRKVLDRGLSVLVYWTDFIKRHPVKAIVLSHDCYVMLNILAKVAYANKIPVYLPNSRGVTFADEPYSVYKYFVKMREIFAALPEQEKLAGIRWAKERMEKRLGGVVGVDMSYSTKTGYHREYSSHPVLKKSDNLKILICSHCFYDNPYAYGEILFEDFYEWLCFLGKMTEKTSYDWYIKMHPDPLPGTEEVIRSIIMKYPRLNFLPPDTSHHQIVEEGINFVFTVYGSVGHEYPAMGVQVVNAGYNPRIAYNFNWNPKTIAEYERMIMNLASLKRDIDLKELYEFYFVQHKYVMADDLFFKSFATFSGSLDVSVQNGPSAYDYFLDEWSPERHEQIKKNINGFIESKNHYYFSKGPEL